jgi:hypothetical protein
MLNSRLLLLSAEALVFASLTLVVCESSRVTDLELRSIMAGANCQQRFQMGTCADCRGTRSCTSTDPHYQCIIFESYSQCVACTCVDLNCLGTELIWPAGKNCQPSPDGNGAPFGPCQHDDKDTCTDGPCTPATAYCGVGA